MMQKQSFNKVLIVGDAGRGKSTLAARISKKIGMPFYSTDDFLYEIKYSVYKEKQKGINEISKIYQDDKWIVEGTTHYLLKPGMELADIIIHLKYTSTFSQLFSIIKRHFKRNDKSFKQTLWLLGHTIYKKFETENSRAVKGLKTTPEHISPHKHKVIVLTSFKEIDNFVESLK